jgi:uncharacterized repeat protein (TIGR04076 family)
MPAAFEVTARVQSVAGFCAAAHKIGDEWKLGHETPQGICIWAWTAIFPFVSIFRYGGSLPWKEGPSMVTIACPDPKNRVVFEIRKVDSSA